MNHALPVLTLASLPTDLYILPQIPHNSINLDVRVSYLRQFIDISAFVITGVIFSGKFFENQINNTTGNILQMDYRRVREYCFHDDYHKDIARNQ